MSNSTSKPEFFQQKCPLKYFSKHLEKELASTEPMRRTSRLDTKLNLRKPIYKQIFSLQMKYLSAKHFIVFSISIILDHVSYCPQVHLVSYKMVSEPCFLFTSGDPVFSSFNLEQASQNSICSNELIIEKTIIIS